MSYVRHNAATRNDSHLAADLNEQLVDIARISPRALAELGIPEHAHFAPGCSRVLPTHNHDDHDDS